MATGISLSAVDKDWRGGIRIALAVLALAGCGLAKAESSWMIAPRVTVAETYSDNMGLMGTAEESGMISDLAPGIRIDGRGARFTAFLDYSREYLFYQGVSEWNRQQNQLNSYATLEAIENRLFLDASANIVQRNISVFGPVSVDSSNASRNQVETRTFQLAPYLKGRIGSFADYLVRLNAVDSRSDDPTFANTRVDQVVASINNRATAGRLGWFADGTGTRVENDVVGARDNTRFRGGLAVPLGSHINVSAHSGRETTNFASVDRESLSTPGAGIEWSPSHHTQLAAVREKRFFGHGHNILFSHRTGHTAWRYTDTKDALILPTLLAGYNPGSVQALLADLLEGSIPDQEERRRAVRARLDMMGAASDLPGGGGVQTSRFYVEHERAGSFVWLGIRSMLSLVISQRDQELLPFSPTAVDSFQDSSKIRERGTSLAWLYRLTPVSTLNLVALRLRTEGLDDGAPTATQNSQTASLNVRLSPKAVASVGVRRSRFEHSVTGSIDENAVVASLTQRF